PVAGAPWPAGGAAGLSGREVGDLGLNSVFDNCGPSQSGLCLGTSPGSWSDAVVSAAMGTRGNPFTLSRGVLPQGVQTEWTAIDGAFGSTITFTTGAATPVGSGYFDNSMSHS